MITRELTNKEYVFVKWFLSQQKQAFIVLCVAMSPFVLFALGAVFFLVKEKIQWFETSDFIVLFGGLGVIFLLIRMVIKFIIQKSKTDFDNVVYQFSGVYHIEQTGNITTGVNTTLRTPIMAHKIGDKIISGSNYWQFKEDEFYEIEGIPIKLSKIETDMYKTSHQYLMLTRKNGSSELSVEDDIDSGLLKTRNMIPIVIVTVSIFYIFAFGLVFSLSINQYLNKILIGIFVIIGLVDLIQIIKIRKRFKLLKFIKEKHSK